MFLVRPPFFVPILFYRIIWKIPVTDKRIFLTFDDGPIPQNTPWILSILKQFNAKATFFCVGDNVRKYPDLFNLISLEGHAIGNHTYHHLNGWKNQTNEYLKDVEDADNYINSPLFRPPYGKINYSTKEILLKKYFIIMWDVLSRDYSKIISPQDCYNNVINYAQPGSIVVFHDSLKATKNLEYTLPRVLRHYSNEGYTFSPLLSNNLRMKNPIYNKYIKMDYVKSSYKSLFNNVNTANFQEKYFDTFRRFV